MPQGCGRPRGGGGLPSRGWSFTLQEVVQLLHYCTSDIFVQHSKSEVLSDEQTLDVHAQQQRAGLAAPASMAAAMSGATHRVAGPTAAATRPTATATTTPQQQQQQQQGQGQVQGLFDDLFGHVGRTIDGLLGDVGGGGGGGGGGNSGSGSGLANIWRLVDGVGAGEGGGGVGNGLNAGGGQRQAANSSSSFQVRGGTHTSGNTREGGSIGASEGMEVGSWDVAKLRQCRGLPVPTGDGSVVPLGAGPPAAPQSSSPHHHLSAALDSWRMPAAVAAASAASGSSGGGGGATHAARGVQPTLLVLPPECGGQQQVAEILPPACQAMLLHTAAVVVLLGGPATSGGASHSSEVAVTMPLSTHALIKAPEARAELGLRLLNFQARYHSMIVSLVVDH